MHSTSVCPVGGGLRVSCRSAGARNTDQIGRHEHRKVKLRVTSSKHYITHENYLHSNSEESHERESAGIKNKPTNSSCIFIEDKTLKQQNILARTIVVRLHQNPVNMGNFSIKVVDSTESKHHFTQHYHEKQAQAVLQEVSVRV